MKALNDTYDKRYLSIAMPAAVESVFMILLSAADLIMVGPLGAGAVAAVSIFFAAAPCAAVLFAFHCQCVGTDGCKKNWCR